MRKAIGALALGIVLLCPTAWADENKRKQIDQLSNLMGLWQFFVQVPAEQSAKFVQLDKAEHHWYFLNNLYGNGPTLTGFAPNVSGSKVGILPRTGPNDGIIMTANLIDGDHVLCWMFRFDLPQDSSRTIGGTVRFIRSKRTALSKELEMPLDCNWRDGGAQRGLFSGSREW